MNRRRGDRAVLVAFVVFAVLGARVDASAQAPAAAGPITIGVLASRRGSSRPSAPCRGRAG